MDAAKQHRTMSYNAQDSPATKNFPAPNVSIAQVENPALRKQTSPLLPDVISVKSQ